MANTQLTQTGTQVQADLDKVEGLATIKTIGTGLALSNAGELTATATGLTKVATISLSCTATENAKSPNSTTGTIDYTKPMIIQISPNQNITARAIYGGQYSGSPYFYCRASDVTTVNFDVYQ